ncbi:MAG: glycosyltransferase [Sulfitobacter pontiacus]|uniref:glycosyltransferase family 4 protein n=1 Tax=Pseudomonadota TaxID=1224 RepID=UPI0032650CE1
MTQTPKKLRVVHLIPYDGIGGVEIAAHSLPTGWHENLLFERQYLVREASVTPETGEYHGPSTPLNDPRAYWHALWCLVRNPPDLLVASLWRSALVLICFKILRPSKKTVIFLHLAHDVHLVDKLANSIAMRLCDAIWADSTMTLTQRVPQVLRGKGRTISFLLTSRPLPTPRAPRANFVFWGRLNAQKGLDRSLELFAAIARRLPEVCFTIIGPDGGMGKALRAKAKKLNLESKVVFSGPMLHDDISQAAAQASFYLQTSHDEGMAMAVVEAMQAGLVPVVTPVGEIARYCRDGENAVIVRNDETTVNTVLALLEDSDRYKRISSAAAKYWQSKPLYRDDFLIAAKELMGGQTNAA